MGETKTQVELTGLERFGQLEDRIYRMVEAFKALSKESETLRAENQNLRTQIEALRESESTHNESLAHLQKEREELRERVEKALSLLATLEVR